VCAFVGASIGFDDEDDVKRDGEEVLMQQGREYVSKPDGEIRFTKRPFMIDEQQACVGKTA